MSHLRYGYNLISIRYIYLFEFDSSLGFTQNTHHMPNMLWKIQTQTRNSNQKSDIATVHFFYSKVYLVIPLIRICFEEGYLNCTNEIFFKKTLVAIAAHQLTFVCVCSVAPGKISSWISSRISYIEWRNENRANKVYSDSISFCWYLSVCRF